MTEINPVQMGLEYTPEIFNLLLDNIYSDVPLAVIRETLNNSRDASIVKYGHNFTETPPIEIQLPSEDNKLLIVRDYGTGLSESEVYLYLNNLFSSNKKGISGSDLTGEYGLGSKALLIVSDHYLITSFYEGFKTVYAFKRENKGIPTLEKISQEPSSEPSGLLYEVLLNEEVSSSNFRSFSVMRFLSFFNYPLEFFSNFHIKEKEEVELPYTFYSQPNPRLALYTEASDLYSRFRIWSNQSSLVLSGGTVYSSPNFLEFHGRIPSLVPVISIEPKELEFPLSREQIINTPENINKIKSVVSEIYVDLAKKFQKNLQEIKDKNLPEDKEDFEFLLNFILKEFKTINHTIIYNFFHMTDLLKCYNEDYTEISRIFSSIFLSLTSVITSEDSVMGVVPLSEDFSERRAFQNYQRRTIIACNLLPISSSANLEIILEGINYEIKNFQDLLREERREKARLRRPSSVNNSLVTVTGVRKSSPAHLSSLVSDFSDFKKGYNQLNSLKKSKDTSLKDFLSSDRPFLFITLEDYTDFIELYSAFTAQFFNRFDIYFVLPSAINSLKRELELESLPLLSENLIQIINENNSLLNLAIKSFILESSLRNDSCMLKNIFESYLKSLEGLSEEEEEYIKALFINWRTFSSYLSEDFSSLVSFRFVSSSYLALNEEIKEQVFKKYSDLNFKISQIVLKEDDVTNIFKMQGAVINSLLRVAKTNV